MPSKNAKPLAKFKLQIGGKAAAAVFKYSQALGKTLNDTGSYLLAFGVVFSRYVGIIHSSKTKNSATREEADYHAARAVISEVRAARGKLVNDGGIGERAEVKISVGISTELFKAMHRTEIHATEEAAIKFIMTINLSQAGVISSL